MSILVTGSSGRIGSAIVRRLRHKKLPVIGVDIHPGETTDNILDINNTRELETIAAGAAAIIHCAALHAPHVGQKSEQEFWQTNVELTRILISCCAESANFVYTSSTSVYGHALQATNQSAVWIDETVTSKPRDIYDVTKLAAEELLKAAANGKRSITILRMSRCFPERLRDMVLYRLYRGVDIRDVVQAHLLALGHQQPFSRFVISGPPVFQQAELSELASDPWSCILRHAPELNAEFENRGWAVPRSIDRVYSSRLAIAELGYRPRYGVTSLLNSV